MLEKLSSQQRVFLAAILSFVVFVAYDFFFVPKYQPEAAKAAPAVQEHNSAAAAPAPVETKSATVSAAAGGTSSVIARIKTPESVIEIDALGRLAQVTLERPGMGTVALFKGGGARPLEIRFVTPEINAQAFKTPYSTSAAALNVPAGGSAELLLTQQLTDMNITKKVRFYADGHYDVAVSVSNGERFYLALGARPDVMTDGYTFHGVLIADTEGKNKTHDDESQKGDDPFANMRMAAAADRYYANLFYDAAGGLVGLVSADGGANPVVYLDGRPEMKFMGYVGPKEVDRLRAIDEGMTDVVEYGFFTFIARPIFAGLAWIEAVVGNWGWAIVVLTIIIRFILFPLTYRGMISMGRIKELAPKLQELREKYKGDPQKLNIHVMELYQKNKVNPLGGCLPILLQIPIFFAIYRVLLNAIELQNAPWILWITDLSVMDQYYVLPILMGITMFIQQKITPTNFTDPIQQKVFMWLPIIFTFFFITFPAGLTLYWFVNNLFSIAQQFAINRVLERQQKVEE